MAELSSREFIRRLAPSGAGRSYFGLNRKYDLFLLNKSIEPKERESAKDVNMENTANEVNMENPRVCPETGVAYCDMKIVPEEWSVQMDRAFHDYRCSTCGTWQDCGTPVPYCVKDEPSEWNCVPCERKEQKLVKADVAVMDLLSSAGIKPETGLAIRLKLSDETMLSLLKDLE